MELQAAVEDAEAGLALERSQAQLAKEEARLVVAARRRQRVELRGAIATLPTLFSAPSPSRTRRWLWHALRRCGRA